MATPIGAIVVDFIANIARFFTDCDKVNEKSKKTANDIHVSFSKIAEITLGVSFARGLEGIAEAAKETVKEIAKLGLEAKVQEGAFEALTHSVGVSGGALADALKQASGDIINTSDVLLAATRGLVEGFQPDQLVKLMEVARQQAKLTGKDVVDAFNAITTAIANQQVRGLKQMGLVIDTAAVFQDYAAALGVTAQELTESAKAQAIYLAVVERSKATVAALTTEQLTQSEILQQLAGNWKQLKEDMGKALVDVGFAVLAWAQDLSAEIGPKMRESLAQLSKIWTQVWGGAVAAIQPVSSILKDVLVPALKIVGVLSASLGVGLAAAFSVVAGPMAYFASIIGDLAAKRIPDFARATLEANAATADARVRLAEAGEAFKVLQDSQGAVQAELPKTSKAITDLGTNALGLESKVRALPPEFDSLAKAMRALSEKGAEVNFGEFEIAVEGLAKGVVEAATATKNLSPELRQFFETWARGIAQTIALQDFEKETIKEITKAVDESSDVVSRDLTDEADIWRALGKSIYDAGLIADVTQDSTGGLDSKIKAVEQSLAKATERFGAFSDQAQVFRDRLQELRNEFDSLEGRTLFEAPTGDTQKLLVEADIWNRLGQAMAQAGADGAAAGTKVQILQGQMGAAARAVSEAATAFGTSSEEFLAFRQRFVEIRTEFDKANLAEQLRVIDAQAQLFGATFEKLPAQIDATKSAILDLLHEGLEPTDPAIQALTTRLRELQLIQDTVGTVFDSLNQTLTTSVKGVLLGTQTIGDAFKNLGQNIAVSLVESAVKRMLKTIENYLIDFLESEAFKKFLLFLLNLGVSATGSASGSTPGFSPSPTTTGFASGGIVQHQPGGRLVLAGEGGQDEAIIPLPALAHFGGGSNVEVNVITPPGSRVEQRERSGPDGKQIRDIVITMVGDALGNGTFDPVMKGSYGAVRKGISR